MQSHNGMRPQDIIVLLKLALMNQESHSLSSLSNSLGISSSEISKSIQRSQYAGLLNANRKVATGALIDFIKFGLPYVFPAKAGAPVRGIPTAISHPKISGQFPSDETLVWPSISGASRGHSIDPLIPALPGVAQADGDLYFAAALVDVLRTGKAREKQYAEAELKKLLKK